MGDYSCPESCLLIKYSISNFLGRRILVLSHDVLAERELKTSRFTKKYKRMLQSIASPRRLEKEAEWDLYDLLSLSSKNRR